VTNYEVYIRLDPASYADLIDPGKPKQFPFRPGMNASADIKTKKMENVPAVPIAAVAARVKGSDESLDDKKKAEKGKQETEADVLASADELEEVVFILKPDGKVEKRIVKTGIQDINYIQILSGLNGNEQVITAPYEAISKTLKSGTKVNVVTKDKLFEK
jgi:HlyD family secretion protein